MVTRNPLTGETEVRRVVATSHSHTDRLLALTLDDALTGEPLETIEATRQHPIAVVGKGFVPAAALGIGSLIVTRAGPPLVVGKIEWERRAEGYDVYNLIVEGDHTYFVGDVNGGVWVHNGPGTCIPSNASVDNLPEVRGNPVSPRQAGSEWDKFLGNGSQDNIHPRTGQPDPNRIVTQTGPNEYRSIRYGNNEMAFRHYHEETWTYDPIANKVTVKNVHRAIHPK